MRNPFLKLSCARFIGSSREVIRWVKHTSSAAELTPRSRAADESYFFFHCVGSSRSRIGTLLAARHAHGGGALPQRIALISEHASPLAAAGGVDAGGQNIYVAQVARHLARLGYGVDVFTRRDSPKLPEVLDWLDGVRVVHVPAGPASYVRKEEFLPFMPEFSAFVRNFASDPARNSGGYRAVHANFFMSGLAALELKRSLRIPFVITFHALGRVRRLHQGDADQFP